MKGNLWEYTIKEEEEMMAILEPQGIKLPHYEYHFVVLIGSIE